METDFYKILGIDKSASEDDIKKAYRKLAMKYHPDRQQGKSDSEKKEAEEMFKNISAAYECLSDSEKRQAYDQFGLDGLKGNATSSEFEGMPSGLAEFLRRHMGGFGFNFGFEDDKDFNPFSHQRSRKRNPPSNNEPEDGRSYRVRMALDLEDVIYGKEKEFSIDGFVVCPECHGHKCDEYEECSECHGFGMSQHIDGYTIIQSTCRKCGGSGFMMKNKCKKCNGSGRIEAKREYKVKIPKGFPEGGQLRVKGGAEPGLLGGKDGDLYLRIQTKDHPLFRRIGELDLEVIAYASPLINLFGGKISFPTPYGIKEQDFIRGIESNYTFKLNGYGIGKDDSAIKIPGDLYVKIVYDKLDINAFNEHEQEVLQKAAMLLESNKKCCLKKNEQNQIAKSLGICE